MRCFYHTDIALPMRALQQRSQLCQSLTTDTRRLRDTHEPASGCIEHPLRDGQRPPGRLFLLQSTVEDRFAALSYRGVNRNVTIEPRMPRISENTELGNVEPLAKLPKAANFLAIRGRNLRGAWFIVGKIRLRPKPTES